jgi:hypothetical protein
MKKTLALLSLTLLLAATAAEAGVYIQPPPSSYGTSTHNLSIQYASTSQIRRYCGHPRAMGCAYAHSRGCTIIIPHGTSAGSMLYRHEVAHCNGWSKHHH